jgi:hypothetical protein
MTTSKVGKYWMSVEENKGLMQRYFEDAPFRTEICDQIFAPHVIWHALYRSHQPDFVSTPEAEKAAYAKHISLWGSVSE